jgi:hypothetical protein
VAPNAEETKNRDNRKLLQNLDLESARLLDDSLALSSCAVYQLAEQSFKACLQTYNLYMATKFRKFDKMYCLFV